MPRFLIYLGILAVATHRDLVGASDGQNGCGVESVHDRVLKMVAGARRRQPIRSMIGADGVLFNCDYSAILA